MGWRDQLFVLCISLVCLGAVAVFHFSYGNGEALATSGADGILWQIQSTFFSIGFAGIAIAAQLFAETPLAIGASRGRVLEHINAGWFVAIGLASNLLIAVEVIWLPSDGGVVLAFAGTVGTVASLVLVTGKLVGLFGHPSRLDQVVKISLVQASLARLSAADIRYKSAREQILNFSAEREQDRNTTGPTFVSTVAVPEAGRVLRSIRLQYVRQALSVIGPQASTSRPEDGESPIPYEVPQISVEIEPGDRTRLSQTAFRIISSAELGADRIDRATKLLRSSVEFEPPGASTPEEESSREIEHLQDIIGVSVRSGAFAAAERALALLGEVVRDVWIATPQFPPTTRRSSIARRDWLFRSIGEVELDVTYSPRVATAFVSGAMTRAVEAPHVVSTEYVDECLRSLTRMWLHIAQSGDRRFDSAAASILTSLQNLAAYIYPAIGSPDDWGPRATWSLVELVKLALDAERFDLARSAAQELDGLHLYDRDDLRRRHVRGGQLVLTAWLDLLAARSDERGLYASGLRSLVQAKGTVEEIRSARALCERGNVAYARWHWWEVEASTSGRAQTLEMSFYLDRAELDAMAKAYGPLPMATTTEVVSDYRRFSDILRSSPVSLTAGQKRLLEMLNEEVRRWNESEHVRMEAEPISPVQLESIRASLSSSLRENGGLARAVGTVDVLPEGIKDPLPILGMSIRVPRRFVVDPLFDETHVDSAQLGQIIARGFVDGEDRKIVDVLESIVDKRLPATARAIEQEIKSLSDARQFVFATPYGGLEGVYEWYSGDFERVLANVLHIETSALEDTALLFHRFTAIGSYRSPEEKMGLEPVGDTSIALGLFEDVNYDEEPEVRLESGERFSVWPTTCSSVVKFGQEQPQNLHDDPDTAEGSRGPA